MKLTLEYLNNYRWVNPNKHTKKPKIRKNASKRIKIQSEQRDRIYKRDGYRCIKCGMKYDLNIHHKKKVSEGGTNDDDNLVTLCVPCHAEEHPDIAIFMLQAWYNSLLKEFPE